MAFQDKVRVQVQVQERPAAELAAAWEAAWATAAPPNPNDCPICGRRMGYTGCDDQPRLRACLVCRVVKR